MKKNIIVLSAMIAFAGATTTPVAMAALNTLVVKFDCPTKLNNLSSFISGIGSEQIGLGATNKMQFKGSLPASTPLDLSSYSNSNTKYNACHGVVTCQYQSSLGWPVLYVSYTAEQARNGIVIKQTAKELNIKVPFGLHV